MRTTTLVVMVALTAWAGSCRREFETVLPAEAPGPAAAPITDTPPTMPVADARAAGFLPAGLYFRNGYLRWIHLEEGWPNATHAVVVGPFPDAREAQKTIEALAFPPLPPGYPMALHSDELGLLDETKVGVVVVLGFFAEKAAADAWRTGHPIPDARVEALADLETAFDREMALEGDFGEDMSGPLRLVFQIVPGDPVPAYPRGAVDAAEDAHFNWATEDSRGPDPLVQAPTEPLCIVQPGDLFLVRYREAIYTYYRWAPVHCGEEPAYVPWIMTTKNSVVVPQEDGTYRMIQVGEVQCDVACFCEWTLDDSGARILEGDLRDYCACPPSCGGEGCS